MIKVHPDELRSLKADLDRLRHEHSRVINAEPALSTQIDGAREYAERRYHQVAEFEPPHERFIH